MGLSFEMHIQAANTIEADPCGKVTFDAEKMYTKAVDKIGADPGRKVSSQAEEIYPKGNNFRTSIEE
ncbi:hypothetical protein CHS0354_026663 [Potamilus streckersoni]|uniref:Uncharacterized protein n=1 Tax=Potamilus streckersoni TaxID=2493646 RepID=A0AAE0VS02_9BIVA|nr:hypothetical protein CHS0354_026663 [Potamilus streckersoni]